MADSKNASAKDVLYIDVDDEITGIIDKIAASKHKIVALVLPKRASVLQSVVNMKLLKRSADTHKKNVVLITSEAGLLPLAGSVGVHVAKTLQSKPEIPDSPTANDDQPEEAEDDTSEETEADDPEDDATVDASKTVGELAGAAVVEQEVDTIELDPDAEEDDEEATDGGKPAKGKNKKLKVPNFNKFRLVLILAIVGVFGLIGFGYAAVAVLPKAQVTIKTDSTAVDSVVNAKLTLGEGVVLDLTTGVIGAQVESTQKTKTEQVPATGSRNDGEKASGSVTLSLTDCSKDQVTVPAGTGVTSGGKTFITSTSATMQSVKIGNQCKNNSFPDFSSKTVTVVAQSAGAAYNVAAGSFSIKGYSNVSGSSSAAMDGGTDVVVKVVAQADIDAASQKITSEDASTISAELEKNLSDKGLFAIESTFNTATPSTQVSAKVGDAADTVTVTQNVSYAMLGVKKDDLEKLVADSVKADINTKKQSILDYGLTEATYTLQETTPTATTVQVRTTVVAGPDLDVKEIKKQIAGKKAGDAQDIIKANPGVTDVVVEYSPFWVGSIPNNADKITVTVEKPAVVKASTDSSNADTEQP